MRSLPFLTGCFRWNRLWKKRSFAKPLDWRADGCKNVTIKFTNLKNSSFSRFVQAIFTFVHFAFVCAISTTTNHLLCNFQFFFFFFYFFFSYFFCNCIYFKPNDWKSREIIAVIIILDNFLAFADITRRKIRRLSDRISRLSLAFFSWIHPITKNGKLISFEINFTAKSWW